MRTTLVIDDEVLEAARALAERRGATIGEVISDLARRSLSQSIDGRESRNGIPLLPLTERGGAVTTEMVNALRNELQ